MANYTLMASIKQTAARCRAEHIGLSEANIRALVQEGRIPFVVAGTRKLVNFNVLMEYLEKGYVDKPEPGKAPVPPKSEWGKVYAIPENLPRNPPRKKRLAAFR